MEETLSSARTPGLFAVLEGRVVALRPDGLAHSLHGLVVERVRILGPQRGREEQAQDQDGGAHGSSERGGWPFGADDEE